MKPPKMGTKRFKEIVAKGCGGHWTYSSNGDDFDCEFEYDWIWDDCPIVTNQHDPNPIQE